MTTIKRDSDQLTALQKENAELKRKLEIVEKELPIIANNTMGHCEVGYVIIAEDILKRIK